LTTRQLFFNLRFEAAPYGFRMTNFKPDCTINLHVTPSGSGNEKGESKGGFVWACSVVHYKRGRVVLAGGRSNVDSREKAERTAALFALRQTQRLLQEKVEVAANFSLKGMLPPQEEKDSGRKQRTDIESNDDDLLRAWKGFRLRRISRLEPGEAEFLKKESAQF
jgi:hypothetical protein